MQRLFFVCFRFMLGSLLLCRVIWLRILCRGPYREPARILDPGAAADLARRDARFGKLSSKLKRQVTESSCSAASIACVINAMAPPGPPPAPDQMALVDRVRAGNWKERLSPGGWQGRRGLPLDVLGEVVAAAFTACAMPADVRVIPFYSHESTSDRMARARRLLDAFYHDPKSCMIAHFDQGAFLPELNIPHISPVGAWDPVGETVTLLDVDMDQENPYQVSLARFADGIASNYGHILKPYGYDHGGLVVIRVRPATTGVADGFRN